MIDFRKLVRDHEDLIISTRRDLHRIPEPAYTEQKTSAYVADYLAKLGLEMKTGIAQFGVVGLLATDRPGPTLLIRSDMDALPVTEATKGDFGGDLQFTFKLINLSSNSPHLGVLRLEVRQKLPLSHTQSHKCDFFVLPLQYFRSILGNSAALKTGRWLSALAH